MAIVTGGGSGIGRAASLALAQEGYSIAVAGRRVEPLDRVVRGIKSAGHEAIAVPTDVRDPSSVGALFRAATDTYGRLDLLFNNAGITGPTRPLEELTYEEWSAVVETNLTGAFLCTQEAFRQMKSQQPGGGRIINNGSISAHSPRSNAAPYAATKHAITGLTKSTSLEGRKYNIACGQIDIGNAATELAERLVKEAEERGDRVEPMIDLGDVARAVVYMASLPLGANVQFMTLMATKMPFIGRG